jgi:hypothetical protein
MLKYWFAFDTKGFGGRKIDWLMWRLTTTIARHYMHILEMKKKGCRGHYYTKCEKKATLIPLTHVY